MEGAYACLVGAFLAVAWVGLEALGHQEDPWVGGTFREVGPSP